MAMQISFRNPAGDLIERMRIRYTPAEVQVKSHLSRFDIETTPVELHIRQRTAEIDAEWDHVWEDLGLKKPLSVAREQVSRVTDEWLENVARTARDGDRLRDSAGRDPGMIAKLAWERVRDTRTVEVVIDALPDQGPRIRIITHQPEIDVKVGAVELDVGIEGPKIDIRLGGVDIWFLPRPLVDVTI